MKNLLISTFLVSLLSLLPLNHGMSNPFSCKLNRQTQRNSNRPRTKTRLAYKGYALMKKQQFAIIQIGKKQYTVKLNDRVEGIEVLEIMPESLTYRQNQRTFVIDIETQKSEINEEAGDTNTGRRVK